MAREAAVRVTCDRTGEESYAPVGVTLATMNEGGGAAPDAALELTFRPVYGGEGMELIFNDLSPRAERQVRELLDAIAAEGYFVISPLDEKFEADVEPVEVASTPAPAQPERPVAKAKSRSRRSFVEIEADMLNETVEAASSALAVLLESPDADDISVADAREVLRDALTRSEYFKALPEKDQREHVTAARASRKAGTAIKYPSPLPELDENVLAGYGLLDGEVEVSETAPKVSDDGPGEAPPDDDDDDIFTAPSSDGEQVDFL